MTLPAAFDPLELLEKIRLHLQAGQQAYLVGGAVRDLLRQKPVHDLDFAVSGDVRRLARQVANALDGAFYVMDAARETLRVILTSPGGERIFLDFAALRGENLLEDLHARDFTVNAIAIDLRSSNRIVDPLGGAEDLRQRMLRACAPDSFQRDPVRILRAVRQSLEMEMRITPETLRQARMAASQLARTSAERQRDELFRMLEGCRPDSALRLLDALGVLEHVLPEMKALQGVTQSKPHTLDVWEHTLKVMDWLGRLMSVLVGDYKEDSASDLFLGLAVLRLGRYRQQLLAHIKQQLVPDRGLRALLMLAAAYHDAGKPVSRTVDADGRIRFLGHEQVSQQMVEACGTRLALSSAEIGRLSTIIKGHMRVHQLADGGQTISRKAIYRYFRDLGASGVDVCLLSLADTLATYGFTLETEVWQRELDACRALLEAWWETSEAVVRPPRLVNGDEIMVHFQLAAGPQVGRLLEAIREAQAEGLIVDREAALRFAGEWLQANSAAEGEH